MVRIVGDDNRSDAERIAAIQEATGVSLARAEQMLEQSRGAPIGDRVGVYLSASTSTNLEHALRGYTAWVGTEAEAAAEEVLAQG